MTRRRRLAAVMFTDMAGYTALFQVDERDAIARRDAYAAAVQRAHDEHGGTIVQWMGDGTMSTFASAASAVEAAVWLQRALRSKGVDIRIGMHAGEIIEDGTSIMGDAVNVASRVESFSVVGAVLVSDGVRDLIHNRPDLELGSLGAFRLKNVRRPMELFCVVADGIVVPDRPSLEGKGEPYAGVSTDLPSRTGALFGREDDLVALADAVRGGRLVTVTGPGGVGKTRVLVELGHRLMPEFPDGVAFVELADVGDPADFIPAVAERLDVKEAEGRSLAEGIAALIGSRRALLLLDNLEQIIDAAPYVAAFIARCPALHVVVTSRTPLRLTSEREFPLLPLAVDEPSGPLAASPAVALFVERATTPAGPFVITDENAPTVAEICRRLDGLPLALELAAARLRLLTPEALLQRLGHALDVLTTGPRDLPARHRTLRATIDWSHSLLSEDEQRLLRRMSVFSGGCTIEELEAVCGGPCLDLLESLVEKALVQITPTGRCTMLQTIAEYAGEQLAASGERDEVAARHAAAFTTVAREIHDGLEQGRQIASLERGTVEEPNLSAALDTLLAAATAGDAAAAEAGQRACSDLNMYWHIRGKNLTAREVSHSFIAAGKAFGQGSATAGAMRTAGLGAMVLGQIETANAEWAAAVAIADEVGDPSEQCLCNMFAIFGLIGIDTDLGKRSATRAIEISRATGYHWVECFALLGMGFLHHVAGELDDAHRCLDEALAIAERIGEIQAAGLAFGGLAALAAAEDTTRALDLYERSLQSFEHVGDRAEEARILSEMAAVYLNVGDLPAARRRLLDSVRAYRDVGSVRGVGLAVLGLAAVASLEGRHETAATIAAAGERYVQQEGIVNVYTEETPGLDLIGRSRETLDETSLQRATAAGATLTIDEAISLSATPR